MEKMRVLHIPQPLLEQVINTLQDAVHPTRTARQINALMYALSQLPEVKPKEDGQ